MSLPRRAPRARQRAEYNGVRLVPRGLRLRHPLPPVPCIHQHGEHTLDWGWELSCLLVAERTLPSHPSAITFMEGPFIGPPPHTPESPFIGVRTQTFGDTDPRACPPENPCTPDPGAGRGAVPVASYAGGGPDPFLSPRLKPAHLVKVMQLIARGERRKKEGIRGNKEVERGN